MVSSISRWIRIRPASASSPRPTAAWFVMTTTCRPEACKAARASSTPGRNSNSAQDLTWSGRRRLITPSRSRKMAPGRGTPTLTLAKQGGPGRFRNGVLEDKVTVFDHAIAVAGDMNRDIDGVLERPTGETDQCNRYGAACPSQLDRGEDVRRIAAGADGHHDVIGVEEVRQLFGEDVVIGGVIGPGREQGNVVAERADAQPRPAVDDRGFGQVAGEVRCRGSTAAVANDVEMAPPAIRLQNDLDHAFDVIHRNPRQDTADFADVIFQRDGNRRTLEQLHRRHPSLCRLHASRWQAPPFRTLFVSEKRPGARLGPIRSGAESPSRPRRSVAGRADGQGSPPAGRPADADGRWRRPWREGHAR